MVRQEKKCTFPSFCYNTVRGIPDNLPAARTETNVAQTKTQDAARAKTVLTFTEHFLLQYGQRMLTLYHLYSRTESRHPGDDRYNKRRFVQHQ